MYYRTLGNTGIITSVFGFGFWATFGVKSGLLEKEGIDSAKKILTVAREGGINLFDNAEAYGNPNGEAERIFGEAYAQLRTENPDLWRRSDVIITTKLFWGGSGQNEKGLSRKHIVEGMDASLKRLQLDYVDLVYCHRADSLTPTETVVRAMTDLVRSGKAMAWGTSEWSAQQITEAYWIATTQGLEPPTVEQPQYNMFHRERFEKEYFPIYRAPYNIATTTWSPLASGLLTGKYNDGVPEGSRVTQKGYEWLHAIIDQWKKEGNLDKVKELTEYAEKNLDCSMAQLALAWAVKNKHATCFLLGATKVEQIEDNLKAIPVAAKLTDKHMEDIDKILGNKPSDFWGNGARKVDDL
uniref:NADP-dependent oxidoreductase domain-containing protein n=1 Tax=Amphora coffeiformis TaxID=265554 RepID=A0A7S3LB24_9STRA|mmetsp:Transcript_7926/g.15380  ORF Transcript_7926/g.15380 Transcript_7926/m.15380 type:complete len:354 (+) Transcript_7926:148-1209(+)